MLRVSRRDLREGQLSNMTRYTQLLMSDGRAGHPEVNAVDNASGSPHMSLPAPRKRSRIIDTLNISLAPPPEQNFNGENRKERKRNEEELGRGARVRGEGGGLTPPRGAAPRDNGRRWH